MLSQALRVEHAALTPMERRAKSWARSVCFAQMTLGMMGIPMKGEDLRHFRSKRRISTWISRPSEHFRARICREAALEAS